MGARGRGARKRRTARRQTARAQGTAVAELTYTEESTPIPVAYDEEPDLSGLEAIAAVERATRFPRAALVNALRASGEAEPDLVANYDMSQGAPAELWFLRRALKNGFTELSHDSWPTEVTALELDDRLVFRCDDHEHVYELEDGTLAHVTVRYGMLRVSTAGPSVEAGRGACEAFRALYPASYITVTDDGKVPVTFWSDSNFGPVPRLRRIDSTRWEPIEGNYSAEVRAELAREMGWTDGPDTDGQLLLWQGPPGTGKTWALRALASEWAPWAEFHYITDPDAFFVKNPSYMIDVLLADSYQAIDPSDGEMYEEQNPLGKWRVLILEDTGELLSADAKQQYGQGLSRLLNVVDGMIGQGLRVLAIVTTNDELGDLHPAVGRPGRCASQITFGPLNAEEASAFLGEEVEEGGTIAELYARTHGEEPPATFDPVTCANCDHGFADHPGNGACTVEGCSCEMFEQLPVTDPDGLPPTDHTLTEAAAGTGATAGNAVAGEAYVRIVPVFEKFDDKLGRLIDELIVARFDAAGLELPAELQPGSRLPDARPDPVITDAELGEDTTEWSAIFAPEGKLTSDGRAFAPGSISWRELPLTLMAMIETSEGGHVGAEVAGRIDRIWRDEAASLIRAAGVFANTEYGQLIAAGAAADPEWFNECLTASLRVALGVPAVENHINGDGETEPTLTASLVADQTLRGVSVDLAISRYEVGPKSDWFDEDGNWAPKDTAAAEDEPSLIDILFSDEADSIAVVLEAEIGMTTVCPFPAFAEAKIAVGESLVAGANPAIWTITSQAGFTVTRRAATGAPLTASAAVAAQDTAPCLDCDDSAAESHTAALAPPVDAFYMDEPDEVTPWTVEDDGRCYGHAAVSGTCHIGIQGRCQLPPTSNTEYALFHLGEVVCEGGERVQVGTITLDTGHAGNGISAQQAIRHYDDTGTAVAYVRAVDGAHGIWVCGHVREDVPEEKVTLLRGGKLSGDWRKVDGNLELVALLTVNVPGFPVPRARQLVAAGEVVSLVAAGIPVFESELPEELRERFAELRLREEFAELAEAV